MKSFLRKVHVSHKDNTISSPLPSAVTTTDPGATSNQPMTSPQIQRQTLPSPTVIELFQSQGCNSCPPTNTNLLSLNTDAIILTYHVTYWDYLGWRDTFAHRAFDQRQRDYVRRLGLRSAFTPQVVVNGRASGVGSTLEGLARVIKEGASDGEASVKVEVEVDVGAGAENGDVLVRVSAGNYTGASSGREQRIEVWIVRYDSEKIDVHIKAGENTGRILPHRNLVRSVERLGETRFGKDAFWKVAKDGDGLKRVVLVQEGTGGPIVAAARLDTVLE